MRFTLNVNGESRSVDVDPRTPLLWVLRDELELKGTKFGCGMSLCGACTVHVDGAPIRACITPVSAIAEASITTIEGIGATPIGSKVQAGMARRRRRAVRLLPGGANHVAQRRCWRAMPRRPTPTSTPRWPATSAAAARTRGSAPRSSKRSRCRRPTRARAEDGHEFRTRTRGEARPLPPHVLEGECARRRRSATRVPRAERAGSDARDGREC